MAQFKPNLIKGVDDFQIIYDAVKDNLSDWIISLKKDGVRVELDTKVLGRSLKEPGSLWVREHFKDVAEAMGKVGIVLEGEFYSHHLRFPELDRYWKTHDVRDNYKNLVAETKVVNIDPYGKRPVWKKLVKDSDWTTFSKDPSAKVVSRFETDWPGRTPEFLSTYHPHLQIWLFDCYYAHSPNLTYTDRLSWIHKHLTNEAGLLYPFRDKLVFAGWYNLPWEKPTITTIPQLQALYHNALSLGWEGLILSHKDRVYKLGRHTVKSAQFFKMKEDRLEFDGQVLDILEGTQLKEGAPKSKNELGNTVTSKLQEHREPSGIASAILSEYEGHEIKVSFDGYSHDELRELLQNKQQYIGKWFKYRGMNPTQKVPRHAHMYRNSWRDAK